MHACANKNDPREGECGDVGRRALIAGVKFWKGGRERGAGGEDGHSQGSS